MNCHRVQNLLSAYLDQEISSEERRLIRNHIFKCPTCSKSYEELSNIKSFLGNLEPPTLEMNSPPNFSLSLEEIIAHDFSNNPLMWGKRLFLTSGCVFLFLLTSFYLFPVNEPNNLVKKQELSSPSSNSTPYQIARKQQTDSLVEKKEQEEEKDDYWLDESLLVPGIPVSR